MTGTIRRAVPYTVDGKEFEGVLIRDEGGTDPRPGLLVFPNWLGVTEENLRHAEHAAAGRYALFVVDMLGKGAPTAQEEVRQATRALRADRKAMQARAHQALRVFQAAGAGIELGNLGAIGFCFGATCALELARTGGDLKGVVSLHGGLDAATPATGKPRASLLVLHGAEDPTMSAEDVKAFTDDMRRVGADWTLVSFGGAVHSFTDVGAHTPGRAQYDERTARRAYQMMHQFLADAFQGQS